MRLYYLRRKFWKEDGTKINSPNYDVMDEVVIRAKNPKEARMFASRIHGDEGTELWLNEETSECKFLPQKGMNGVIVRNFNAG